MPCYQVQTVSVEFKVAHVDMLYKAAENLGYSWTKNENQIILTSAGSVIAVDLTRGTAEARDQRLVNELKRAYSQQALKLAAKLGGWQNINLTSTKGQLLRGVL